MGRSFYFLRANRFAKRMRRFTATIAEPCVPPETAFWVTELGSGMCFRTDIPALRHIPLRGRLQNAVEALNTTFH
jgi:hypothetical protein